MSDAGSAVIAAGATDGPVAGGGPWWSRLTVQRWLYLVFAVMIALVAVGTIAGADLLHRTTVASNRLSQRIEPAQAAAFQLQATLIDQETGVRGFALTGDRQFLKPYTQGQRSEAATAARIRRLLPEDAALLRDLDRVEAAAASWRRGYAAPLIARVGSSTAQPVTRASAMDGKRVFDRIRRLFATQNADLESARVASVTQLRHVRTQRNWVFSDVVLAFLVTAAIIIGLMRLLVGRPLEALRRSSRRVAEGDFAHPIVVHGPADLRAVARDVDSMRQRILTELRSSREQEGRLAQQTHSLDAQALELRRSNAELEQFAYVASHDLQEPLRKVASFCQLLEKRYGDVLDERGQQYIDFAVDGAKRMQVLITDLLTFSRVGRSSDLQRTVSLDLKVDKAIANLETAIEESGARIERPDRLPEVRGDATLLVMLWQNLIGNAMKFRAADRTPVITIDCEPGEDDGASWRLSVSDNGIGIPAEFAEKVFVIFQRLHNRETYEGTGIGLALCKKIVDYHGGRIWVDTTYTGGTRICFTLPAQIAGASIPNDLSEPALEGSKE